MMSKSKTTESAAWRTNVYLDPGLKAAARKKGLSSLSAFIELALLEYVNGERSCPQHKVFFTRACARCMGFDIEQLRKDSLSIRAASEQARKNSEGKML